ncbi:hypothetical protein WMF18_28460 [Sorangium sp. So ce315]|uniref:hypothetical protein n=1 Tax=Sorangium sp. So ce315 TaxID=3133299 RepID=UPI003F643875
MSTCRTPPRRLSAKLGRGRPSPGHSSVCGNETLQCSQPREVFSSTTIALCLRNASRSVAIAAPAGRPSSS